MVTMVALRQLGDDHTPGMAQAVKDLFAGIAGRYDLLNRLLSGRQDVRWRRRAIAGLRGGRRALDLACGTFDLGLEALRQGKAEMVIAADFCLPMMQAGRDKTAGAAIAASTADAMLLPFADDSFDLLMVAYGWRNFDDAAASAAEMRRVLRPNGELLILEFFRPASWWTRFFNATFGRFVIPGLGAIIAGDRAAYHYLHCSIDGFLSQQEAMRLLAEVGFTTIASKRFFGGISHALTARTETCATDLPHSS